MNFTRATIPRAMAPAVNFTAVAVVFKNECMQDLSRRASLPFLVLVLVLLVLLVLVVLVLVLVNMPSKPHSDFLAQAKAAKSRSSGQIPGSGLRRMLPRCRRAPRRLACPRRVH